MQASSKFATGITGKHPTIQKQKPSCHRGRKSTNKEKYNLRWQHFYWQGINSSRYSNSSFFLIQFGTHLHSQINWRKSSRLGITVLRNNHIPTTHYYLRNPYTTFHKSSSYRKYICLSYDRFPYYNTAFVVLSILFNITNISFPGSIQTLIFFQIIYNK